MTTSISLNQIVDFFVDRYASYNQLNLTPKQKGVYEFNAKVIASNAAVVAMVSAVAFAVLTKFAAALVVGAIGYFVYWTMQKDLDLMELTQADNMQDQMLGRFAQMFMRVCTADQSAGESRNVLNRLDIQGHDDWRKDRLIALGYTIWMNLAPSLSA